MPRLILDRKVRYEGKSYPINKKGVTDPVPVKKKDISFFKDAGMIVDVLDDNGKKMYLDEKEKIINELQAEIVDMEKKLKKRDEEIFELKAEIEDMRATEDTGVVSNNDGSNSDKSGSDKEKDKETLEEKTVEELYEMAGELEIKGRSKLRNDKEELVKAVKKALAEKAGE